jgi:hypothetical protein
LLAARREQALSPSVKNTDRNHAVSPHPPCRYRSRRRRPTHEQPPVTPLPPSLGWPSPPSLARTAADVLCLVCGFDGLQRSAEAFLPAETRRGLARQVPGVCLEGRRALAEASPVGAAAPSKGWAVACCCSGWHRLNFRRQQGRTRLPQPAG